ncbi:MAG: DUF3618 domain-containing protein [Allosphingosinicella sp.]
MSASELIAARAEAEAARARLTATVGELQRRLSPSTLAGNAWDGVKERTGEAAEGAVEAVKARPVAVSGALAAFALFLARKPIRSAVSRLFADEPPEDLVTTRLADGEPGFDITAPVAPSPPPPRKGAKKK